MTDAKKHDTTQHSERTAPGQPEPEPEQAAVEPGPEPDAGASPDPEVTALRAERDELHDRLMRAMADAENARKRADKDRRDAEQYGGTRIVRDMLPVYDSLQRALASARSADTGGDTAAVVEGVELTLRELVKILERHGVTRITPEAGDSFDPQLHEAMFEAAVPDIPAGGVIQVMAEGFMLHDRLLRPAQVGVSSTPAG